ncbi:hypothetical protein MANAM107_20690 [Actinomyces capricornis]|uniref:Uncharacterized protein n=1 Tax=Actinomyces capricornis TaxID=2755559 RepID=A0ABN6KAS4_9ACTO|nr:hypothetical protein MANAM107_20690 [Actinomyces capricornis]
MAAGAQTATVTPSGPRWVPSGQSAWAQVDCSSGNGDGAAEVEAADMAASLAPEPDSRLSTAVPPPTGTPDRRP